MLSVITPILGHDPEAIIEPPADVDHEDQPGQHVDSEYVPGHVHSVSPNCVSFCNSIKVLGKMQLRVPVVVIPLHVCFSTPRNLFGEDDMSVEETRRSLFTTLVEAQRLRGVANSAQASSLRQRRGLAMLVRGLRNLTAILDGSIDAQRLSAVREELQIPERHDLDASDIAIVAAHLRGCAKSRRAVEFFTAPNLLARLCRRAQGRLSKEQEVALARRPTQCQRKQKRRPSRFVQLPPKRPLTVGERAVRELRAAKRRREKEAAHRAARARAREHAARQWASTRKCSGEPFHISLAGCDRATATAQICNAVLIIILEATDKYGYSPEVSAQKARTAVLHAIERQFVEKYRSRDCEPEDVGRPVPIHKQHWLGVRRAAWRTFVDSVVLQLLWGCLRVAQKHRELCAIYEQHAFGLTIVSRNPLIAQRPCGTEILLEVTKAEAEKLW